MSENVVCKVYNAYNMPFYYSAYGSPQDVSGIDLRSVESFILWPLSRRVVRTGIYLAIPPGYEAQVRPRSGLAARRGITVLNTPGTIDAEYRGEVRVVLYNASLLPRYINIGDRIAQLVFAKVEHPAFIQVMEYQELDQTERGERGFGSTGTA